MADNRCPQCDSSLSQPTCRLVQDTCGHKKCRLCLLQEADGCRQCKKANTDIYMNGSGTIGTENINVVDTVIRYENSKQVKAASSDKSGERDCENRGINLENEKLGLIKKNGAQVAVKTERKTDGVKKRSYQALVIPSHISVLKDPISYRCNVCNKVFNTKSHVKYHIYCKEGSKPLQCTECKKEFINKSHLKIHSYIHAGTKPYTCNICKKSFSANSKLTRHKLLHGQVRPYVCQQCGKSYRTKDSLKIHLLVHSGDKPYKCTTCDAKFSNSSNLQKHMVTHSSEKVHMCDLCGKRFKLKWALTVHRRSHSRLRPHVCSNCSKAFVNAKDLHRHQLIHIDVKAFNCGICGIGFRRKDNLDRHMRNTHPGERVDPIKNPIKSLLKQVKPAENPNAINVITASPARSVSMAAEPSLKKSSNLSVPFANPPLKLAFKTSSFKNNFNLNRDVLDQPKSHPKPYDPCNRAPSPSRTIIKTLGNVSEQQSTAICQKILGPYHPLHYETSFEHKKHAVIKNIKFKLPPEYINLKSDCVSTVKPLEPVENVNLGEEEAHRNNNTYAELKSVVNGATSVIVNGQSQQQELHWRRRTAQNLNLQMKN